MSHERKATGVVKPWVVVADHARVRLFTVHVPEGPLVEVDVLLNAEARLHDEDLVSDAGGSLVHGQRGANGGAHTAGDEHAARRHVTDQFAKHTVDALDKARAEGKMNRLYLVAEPGFLGMIRGYLDGDMRGIVAGEVVHRLTDRTPAQIRAYLPAVL